MWSRIFQKNLFIGSPNNIEKVFVANGFDKRKVGKYMARGERQNVDRPENKGFVAILQVRKYAEKYRGIMAKYGVNYWRKSMVKRDVANRIIVTYENKVK